MTSKRKVVIITGASRGIGAALVKRFRELDYRVVATSRSIMKTGSISDDATLTMVGGAMIGPQNTEVKTTLGALLNGFVHYEYLGASPQDDVPRDSGISAYLPGTSR